MRAGIQRSITASQDLYLELARLEISAVHVGNLQFAARGRFHFTRNVGGFIVEKIQTRHRIVRLRLVRLFLNRYGFLSLIKFNHAIALRIVDAISEDGRAVCSVAGVGQQRRKSVTVKYIIAENQGDIVRADEWRADDE